MHHDFEYRAVGDDLQRAERRRRITLWVTTIAVAAVFAVTAGAIALSRTHKQSAEKPAVAVVATKAAKQAPTASKPKPKRNHHKPVPDRARGGWTPNQIASAPVTKKMAPDPKAASLGKLAQASSTSSETTAPVSVPIPHFDAGRALAHVRKLASFGARSAGSVRERRGVRYIVSTLKSLGLKPTTEVVRLSNGKRSSNVVVTIKGRSARTLILGSHLDSKAPAPGANDNASGCGALLEIARCLKVRGTVATVQLVFFGAEEMIDSNSNHHHFGSRTRAERMSARSVRNTAGMLSVDMIGYGSRFVARSMGVGPKSMVKTVDYFARKRHFRAPYLRDTGSSGFSDHEAFERRGIPVAWVEWREDPVYHTARDTAPHLSTAKVRKAGQLVLDIVYGLNEKSLAKLCKR